MPIANTIIHRSTPFSSEIPYGGCNKSEILVAFRIFERILELQYFKLKRSK